QIDLKQPIAVAQEINMPGRNTTRDGSRSTIVTVRLEAHRVMVLLAEDPLKHGVALSGKRKMLGVRQGIFFKARHTDKADAGMGEAVETDEIRRPPRPAIANQVPVMCRVT